MKIEAKKDYNWSLNYKVKNFKKGEICEITEEIGEKMIEGGYACAYRAKDKKVNESKSIKAPAEIPSTGPEENKAIESAEENKEIPKDSKTKKKK